MAKVTCPACGRIEPFWLDKVPTTGCLMGHASAPCPEVLAKARADAEMRKAHPDAFDENGNIKPGGMVMILNRAWERRVAPSLADLMAEDDDDA